MNIVPARTRRPSTSVLSTPIDLSFIVVYARKNMSGGKQKLIETTYKSPGFVAC